MNTSASGFPNRQCLKAQEPGDSEDEQFAIGSDCEQQLFSDVISISINTIFVGLMARFAAAKIEYSVARLSHWLGTASSLDRSVDRRG